MKKRISLIELTKKKNLQEQQLRLSGKKKVPKSFSHLEKRPHTPVTQSIMQFIDNIEIPKDRFEVSNPNLVLDKNDDDTGFVNTEDSGGVVDNYVEMIEGGVLFNNPYSLSHMMKKLDVGKYQYDSYFPNSNNEVFGKADDYELIRKKQNKSYAVEVMNEGIGYIQKERFKKASEQLTKSIEFDGENAEAYHHRGIAYLRQDMVKKAHDDFEEAIKLNPNNQETRKHFEETKKRINQFERSASKIKDPFEKDFLIDTKSLPKRFMRAKTPPKKPALPPPRREERRDRFSRRDDYNPNIRGREENNKRKRGRPEPMDRNLREPPLKRRKIGEEVPRKNIVKRKKSLSPPPRVPRDWGPGKKMPMSEMANAPPHPNFPVVQSYESVISGNMNPLHAPTNLNPPRYQPSQIQPPPQQQMQQPPYRPSQEVSRPLINLHATPPIQQNLRSGGHPIGLPPPSKNGLNVQRKEDVLRPLNSNYQEEVRYRPSNSNLVHPPPRFNGSRSAMNNNIANSRNGRYRNPVSIPPSGQSQGSIRENITRRDNDMFMRRRDGELGRGRGREGDDVRRRRDDDLRRRRDEDDLRRRQETEDRSRRRGGEGMSRRRREEEDSLSRRRRDDDMRRRREEEGVRRNRDGLKRGQGSKEVSVKKESGKRLGTEKRKTEILKDYEVKGGSSRRDRNRRTPERTRVPPNDGVKKTSTSEKKQETKPSGGVKKRIIVKKKIIKKIVKRRKKRKRKKKKKKRDSQNENPEEKRRGGEKQKVVKENYFTPERDRGSKYSPRRGRDDRDGRRRNADRRVYISPERGRSKYDSPVKRRSGRRSPSPRSQRYRERKYSPRRKYSPERRYSPQRNRSPRKYSGGRDDRNRRRYSRDRDRR